MQISDILQQLFRWAHIVAGILWIGLLWFFNWVNGPFTATMDADTKKKVIPELAPRALFWFRWGAAWTWIFGLLLLGMVFWMGGAALKQGVSWSAGSIIMTLLVFLAAPIYDALANSALGKNPKNFAIVGFILIAIVVFLFQSVGDLSYRGYVMYTGAMFGTIMAFNVWMRIWPSQKKIINGIKTGPPADAAVVALAGARSKHNTYLSVPLVWAMINAHTTFLDGDMAWLYMPLAVLLGWLFVMRMYKMAAKVKGF